MAKPKKRKSLLKRVLSILSPQPVPKRVKPVMPTAIAPTSVQDIIRRGAQNIQLVEIVYPDKEGGHTTRITEPYEFRDGSYFGYDIEKNGIRRYKIDKIRKANVLDQKFTPRWPVKIQ